MLNLYGFDGRTLQFCNTTPASATIIFRLDRRLFVRGNANSDDGLDISDPIWILSRLFYRESVIPCLAALDANGDARVDISDGVYLFNYLFLGGNPPPAPFPECGEEPEGQLACDALQAFCEEPDSGQSDRRP